jgi:hypothetical protein
MTQVTRAKLRHKQVRSILASDTYVAHEGSVYQQAHKSGRQNLPEIRATLRLCHSSGDGRERKVKGLLVGRVDMDTPARGALVGERGGEMWMRGAGWEIIRESGEKGVEGKAGKG